MSKVSDFPFRSLAVVLTCRWKRGRAVSQLPKADRGLKVFGLSKKRKQSLWLCSWAEGIKCQQVTILQTTDEFSFAHVIYWHFYDMCQSALWAGTHGQATDHCSGLCFKCETVRATTKHTAGSIFWPTADTGQDHYLERNRERSAGTKWSKEQERSRQLFEFFELTWRQLSWCLSCCQTLLLKQIQSKCAFSVKNKSWMWFFSPQRLTFIVL